MHYRPANKGKMRRPLGPSSVGSKAPYRQKGAALIIAMLVFAISTALVVAMKSEFTRFFARSANILLAEQAHSYLRGAEELAAMALIADYDKDKETGIPKDDLAEEWALTRPPFALDDGGWMSGSLEDLQGRFNLNALAKPVAKNSKDRFTASQEVFIRLLQALEEPSVSQHEAELITQSVSDWLDADSKPLPDGAEDDYYYSRDPAHRTGNRPMASPSELLAVAYMTPEIYQALLPVITVWPQEPEDKWLNFHTAPPLLLRALNGDKNLSPLSEGDGDVLQQERDEIGFADKAAFLKNSVFGNSQGTMKRAGGLLRQTSSWFLLRAEVDLADRNMRLYSVLERGNRRVDTVVRASGSL